VISVLPLSQRDVKWAQMRFGFSGLRIGDHGSAVTALAMLLNAVYQTGAAHTPASVNDKLREKNAFQGKARDRVAWHLVAAIWPGLQFDNIVECPTRPVSPGELAAIDACLADGVSVPVIAWVDASRLPPGVRAHYVLVVGKTEHAGYIINDPWWGDTGPLCPTYGRNAKGAICGLVLFTRQG